jgi:hypothetical protein
MKISINSDQRRYEKYQAFCQLLDVEAAPFDKWLRETAKISENHDPDRYSTVLRSA